MVINPVDGLAGTFGQNRAKKVEKIHMLIITEKTQARPCYTFVMKHYKKEARKGELEIYKVLGLLADRYNDQFDLLVLPKALEIDATAGTLTLPHYEGEKFNDSWHESNGGAPLGQDLALEIPILIEDLSKIDSTYITSDVVLSAIPRLVFDHDEAIENSGALAVKLQKAGLLSEEDLARILSLLRFRQTSETIVNNGDFYPRNFIRRPDGKIVLIDWEVWNERSPFYVVDHPENVAAVPFVHMWGNRQWQDTYVAELHKRFGFDHGSFTKGKIMKALRLADLWFPNGSDSELVGNQIQIIKDALTENRF